MGYCGFGYCGFVFVVGGLWVGVLVGFFDFYCDQLWFVVLVVGVVDGVGFGDLFGVGDFVVELCFVGLGCDLWFIGCGVVWCVGCEQFLLWFYLFGWVVGGECFGWCGKVVGQCGLFFVGLFWFQFVGDFYWVDCGLFWCVDGVVVFWCVVDVGCGCGGVFYFVWGWVF